MRIPPINRPLLVSFFLVSCSAGSLTEDEKREFEVELARLYDSDDTSDDDAADDDATNDDDTSDDDATNDDDTSDDDATNDDDSADVSDFSTCLSDLLQNSCGAANCHDGTFPPDMGGANLFDQLTTADTLCASVPKYVDLEDPSQSLILQKVRDEQPSNCGVKMPFTGTIAAADLTCVEDWFALLE